jgi:hypothetical protein
MYRHREATAKSDQLGDLQTNGKRVIEGDLCPLAVHGDSLKFHSSKQHTTIFIRQISTHVQKREKNKLRAFHHFYCHLFGFSNLTERLKFLKFYRAFEDLWG